MELYNYKAVVVSVFDGDTIRVDIDLGFSTFLKNQSLRLYGLDAPELKGIERPLGLASRDFVRERLKVGDEIFITTIKDQKEKYGRYLAVVYYGDFLTNLNQELLSNGFAVPYE